MPQSGQRRIMFDATQSQPLLQTGSSWVRLRTLILVRWVAIIGQVLTIAIAIGYFELRLEVGLCSIAIGTSVLANLIASFIFPASRRLTEAELTAMLVFDICQLAALLYLTGGLNNPFAVLILGPVTICATTLRVPAIILTGSLAILLTTAVAVYHLPLVTEPGQTYQMPRALMLGFWAAIVTGVVFVGAYAHRVSSEIHTMGQALLAAQMALAREQKLTDLAGVVAATAHELGTPLATIKLASSELAADLGDLPELQQDAKLISEQADRCRDILQSMGRAGKEDRQLAQAPFSALVREAAEPHLDRGKIVRFGATENPVAAEPEVPRLPEIIHGLRNLIQNAVDFARSSVWIDLGWTDQQITFRIIDDGMGFPPDLIGRIGDPFMRRRRASPDAGRRPEYEGMGLGLFIAKHLLERTGADLYFGNVGDNQGGDANAGERCGAIVEVTWPRLLLEPEPGPSRRPLGENPQITF